MFFRRAKRDQPGLARDETLVLYPSYAVPMVDPSLVKVHVDGANQFDWLATTWQLKIQGRIHSARANWFRRNTVAAVIRHAMRVDRLGDEYFRQRLGPFLLDAASERSVTVRLGPRVFPAGKSESAGLFSGMVQLTGTEIRELTGFTPASQSWLSVPADLPPEDSRVFTGAIQFVAPTGVSIISDVDDTIKHSNVPNRRDLFQNTFARKFVPIPGMPALYQDCAGRGVVFHYVSGSPWQLYGPLQDFWNAEGYPQGSFHLKRFRVRETARKLRGMSPQKVHKWAAIEPILNSFPGRRFVLIGDSGEQDPEIYAQLLAQRPQQIAAVFIRNVRGEQASTPRYQQTFAHCPPGSWALYDRPDDLRPLLEGVISACDSAANRLPASE